MKSVLQQNLIRDFDHLKNKDCLSVQYPEYLHVEAKAQKRCRKTDVHSLQNVILKSNDAC